MNEQKMPITAGLGERDTAIVILRGAGKSIAQVAAELGVSADTVYRHLRRPAVRQALSELRAESLQPAYCRAIGELSPTLAKLCEIRDDPETSAANKVRACVEIISLATGLHKLVDTDTRLASIEAKLFPCGDSDDADV